MNMFLVSNERSDGPLSFGISYAHFHEQVNLRTGGKNLFIVSSVGDSCILGVWIPEHLGTSCSGALDPRTHF